MAIQKGKGLSGTVEVYFGVKTGEGLLEFKSKNKIHKQNWVNGIQNLLRQACCIEDAELYQVLEHFQEHMISL